MLPELADPAPPYVTPKGEVEIYGSATYFIRYPNWGEYSRGGTFEIVPLDLRYPNGAAQRGPHSDFWDLRKYRVEKSGAAPQEIMIGGSMTPTGDRLLPEWSRDKANRRLFFFRPDADFRWVRDAAPIVGDIETGWLGHSYGGNLFQVGTTEPDVIRPGGGGEIYLFYEKVTESPTVPYKTEIFARRVLGADSVDENEIRIIGIGSSPYPAMKRPGGNYLVEGPRPVRMNIGGQDFYIVAFSAGDYATDGYTTSYAWSRHITGPYQLVLTADGKDLLDLGRDIRSRFGLSWVGRPAMYQAPDGSYEVLFHGVSKSILPENEYWHPPTKYRPWHFFRSVYKARLRAWLSEDGVPQLAIPLPR
ncbi:MAG: hypothetical protein KY464_09990 [Gemmatimonadetes bacterium]|nr:hypothetical protein [Gemmatimonadota bacterium]